MGTGGPFTVVSFHAHPDDEALLTAGTLARAVAEGHRVVLVLATSGESGLARGAPDAEELGRRRGEELRASAAAIGAARVVLLGHADSGWPAGPVRGRAGTFADLDPHAVAEELAEVLREEGADVLTTYDAAGGYGHPDHVQVHRVGALAARLAGTPLVLEATVDRELLVLVTRLLRDCPPSCRCPACPPWRTPSPPGLGSRTGSTSAGRWRRRSGRCVRTPARRVPTGACAPWRCSSVSPAPCVGGCWGPSGSERWAGRRERR